MKKRPSKVVWCGIPGSLCNLNCSYCYTGKNKKERGICLYSVEHMLKCFETKRFGGPIFFGGASAGETLLWDGIVDFTKGMLLHGHVVSYTTNMTVTPILEQFCGFPSELRHRLQLDASLHYLELKKLNMLDTFFENLRMLKSARISIAIFLCVSDIYIPYLREISESCKREVGLLPIAGMVRKYTARGGKVITNYSPEVEKLIEETCDTRQWKLQKQIYGQKRTEFCHAGEYSINMSLETGNYTKCWGNSGLKKYWEKSQVASEIKLLKRAPFVNKVVNRIFREPSQIMGNIFKNPDEPIKFEPIGRCPFYDCVCASYLCLGLIPELDVETHSKTYFTRESVSNEVWDFIDSKVGQ